MEESIVLEVSRKYSIVSQNLSRFPILKIFMTFRGTTHIFFDIDAAIVIFVIVFVNIIINFVIAIIVISIIICYNFFDSNF